MSKQDPRAAAKTTLTKLLAASAVIASQDIRGTDDFWDDVQAELDSQEPIRPRRRENDREATIVRGRGH